MAWKVSSKSCRRLARASWVYHRKVEDGYGSATLMWQATELLTGSEDDGSSTAQGCVLAEGQL